MDTMYDVMLRDGHPAPSITEDAGDVVVVLSGGRPDIAVRSFFDALARRDRLLGEDVRATIAVTELFLGATLRPERLAATAQCTVDEALQVLERIADAGVVERLLNRSRSFRLTTTARRALASRIRYPSRRAIEGHWELVRAFLDQTSEVSRDDVARLLGVSSARAAGVIRELVQANQLTFAGPRRGRWVRYRLAPGSKGPARDGSTATEARRAP